ncbi:terpene synthase family protein [Streptomyces sp. I05A-00742]|uniref:terpene synthase family protein n=1 Tax=Streptomyces sp. I05A-00742 TaxID=2732853 RepID=UPI0014894232|nr:terpene synthase family protein [Streptomyces sp. I05A-00742]
MDDHFSVPAIDYRSRHASPDRDAVETHTRNWARRFQLVRTDDAIRHLAECRVGEFACWCYPTARRSVVEFAADRLTWLFLADDQLEEGNYGTEAQWTSVVSAVRAVVEHGDTTGPMGRTPLIRALADLFRRLDTLSPPGWKRRFTAHLLDAMNEALREIRWRENGVPPRLSEYVPLRRVASAVIACFDLIEIGHKVELPADVYQSDFYQEIVHAAVDIIGWTNDLHSIDKEMACGMTSLTPPCAAAHRALTAAGPLPPWQVGPGCKGHGTRWLHFWKNNLLVKPDTFIGTTALARARAEGAASPRGTRRSGRRTGRRPVIGGAPGC